MTSTAERIGTIDWVDLSTPDVEAARAFYAAVLGWTYETTETPMGVYHIARVGGHEAGGLMQSDPDSPAPTVWTMFVKVASVDDMVPAVVNAGGSVVSEPIDIPGGARVAVVADPVGAVFALISGGPEPGADEPTLRRDDPGAVAWCELMSRDPHAAVGFYDAAFGWEAAFEPSTGYTTFRVHGVDVGGLLPMPDEMPADVPFGLDGLLRCLRRRGRGPGESVGGRARGETADGGGRYDLRRHRRPDRRSVRSVVRPGLTS